MVFPAYPTVFVRARRPASLARRVGRLSPQALENQKGSPIFEFSPTEIRNISGNVAKICGNVSQTALVLRETDGGREQDANRDNVPMWESQVEQRFILELKERARPEET